MMTEKKNDERKSFSMESFETFEKVPYNHTIIDNTLKELHNSRTFSPKLAVYYDIISTFCTFAAVLIFLAAFECLSGNNEIKQCP